MIGYNNYFLHILYVACIDCGEFYHSPGVNAMLETEKIIDMASLISL